MRSPRGLLAAIVFLLAFPIAVLYQALFGDSGAEAVLHVVWGTSFALVAFSVFDFGMPRWLTWMGCLSASASATNFLLQGLSQITQNESLTRLSFQVLGQVIERIAIDLLIAWFAAGLVPPRLLQNR